MPYDFHDVIIITGPTQYADYLIARDYADASQPHVEFIDCELNDPEERLAAAAILEQHKVGEPHFERSRNP